MAKYSDQPPAWWTWERISRRREGEGEGAERRAEMMESVAEDMAASWEAVGLGAFLDRCGGVRRERFSEMEGEGDEVVAVVSRRIRPSAGSVAKGRHGKRVLRRVDILVCFWCDFGEMSCLSRVVKFEDGLVMWMGR